MDLQKSLRYMTEEHRTDRLRLGPEGATVSPTSTAVCQRTHLFAVIDR